LSTVTEVVGPDPRERNLIAQEALSQHGEEKLGVFKTAKVFHVMNTVPKGPSGKIQRLRLVGAIEKSEANAV
jgi:acyl-coenzyme A synthetase/AMP-(fatty) acid ligase